MAKIASLMGGLSRALRIDVAYFVRGGAWLGGSYVVLSVTRLALVVLLAYLVDREFYGKYQFLTTVIGVAAIFALPKMDVAVANSVAMGYDTSLAIGTRSKLRWSILGSAVLFACAAYFSFVVPQPFWPAFVVAGVLFPLYAGFTGVLSYYRGKGDFKKAAVYNIISQAIAVIAVIIAVIFTRSLALLIAAMMFFSAIPLVWLHQRTLREVGRAKKIDREVVPFGQHLTLMTFFDHFSPYADKLLIVFFSGFEGLAMYSIAIAIALHLSLTGKLLQFLLLPKFSRAQAHHVARLKQFLLPAVLGVGGVVGLLALAMPVLIPLLFSPKYAASVLYAQVALLYLVFFIPSTLLEAFFLCRKRTKLLYAYNLGTGILNLLLLALLVPALGIMGAVLSKVVLGFFGFVFLTTMLYSRSTNV